MLKTHRPYDLHLMQYDLYHLIVHTVRMLYCISKYVQYCTLNYILN